MENRTLKIKCRLTVICAIFLIAAIGICEAFLALGNYIIENYSSGSEYFPVILVPFSPSGIVSHIIMDALLYIPYVVYAIFFVRWLLRWRRGRERAYLYSAVSCFAALIIYSILRLCYVYVPLLSGDQLYPYTPLWAHMLLL